MEEHVQTRPAAIHVFVWTGGKVTAAKSTLTIAFPPNASTVARVTIESVRFNANVHPGLQV